MFINLLFPRELSLFYQSRAADQFSTTIIGDDVNEDRNARWLSSRKSFEPIVGVVGRTHFQQILAFHQNVGGRKYSFRFEDPTDNSAELAMIDTSEGGGTFQLRQEYRTPIFAWDGSDQGDASSYRAVTLVDPSSAWLQLELLGATYSIRVDENPNFDYLFGEPLFNERGELTASIDEDGTVTLSDDLPEGGILRATFVFHYRVRFTVDQLDRTYVSHDAFQVSAPMIEVGVEEEVA